MTFALRLKSRMKHVGLTQEQLAEKIGTSQAMIKNMLQGKQKELLKFLISLELWNVIPIGSNMVMWGDQLKY